MPFNYILLCVGRLLLLRTTVGVAAVKGRDPCTLSAPVPPHWLPKGPSGLRTLLSAAGGAAGAAES